MKKQKDIRLSFTKREMKEAIAVLDQETKKREEDIRQRTELLCTSLRSQAKAQIDTMPLAIQSLTLKEYCETYKGSVQFFREQQHQQQPVKQLTTKRTLHAEEKSKKRSKAASPEVEVRVEEEKPVPKLPITPIVEPPTVTISSPSSKPSVSFKIDAPKAGKKTDLGPIFIHMERPNHPKFSLRLDPEHTIEKVGRFTITAPSAILKQLDNNQKMRLKDQIQSLQEQLEDLKKSL